LLFLPMQVVQLYRMPDAKRRRKIPRRKIPKKVGVVGATAATPAAARAATRGEVAAGAGVVAAAAGVAVAAAPTPAAVELRIKTVVVSCSILSLLHV
jgi:hypothetical protein